MQRGSVTVPNEVILKDKHQQYVNVAESTLVRRRDTSAICENAIGGLAQHLLVIEYGKDKQRIRSCFLQSLLDSLTYRLIYSLYFAQFDSAYLMILRFLFNFRHYSQCWECLTAGNHPLSPEKKQILSRSLIRGSFIGPVYQYFRYCPFPLNILIFLCNFSYYSQSWEWLTAVNHPTVKLVPTLNWTPKFPNGKLDPHSIYQI